MPPAWEAGLNEANAQITNLRATVSELESKIASLTEQVRAIKEGLGL
jgi:outer membrane murein-binding lipoprotein Lpp